MARPKKKQVLLFIILAVIIGGIIYYITSHGRISTDDAAIDSYVVGIAPKVSGYVKSLTVIDNQVVKKGDLILEIDPIDYKLSLDSAQANLSSATASWENSKTNLRRYQTMIKGAFSKQ